MGNKKKKQTKQTDRRIRGVIAVLVILILGVVIYGISSQVQKSQELSENDPLAILELTLNGNTTEIEKCGKGKEAAYYIKVTVPEDFEFSKVPIELKLADGAVLSEESNCLVTDLAGRIIISLQVEHPILTVENGDQKRDYQFLISVDS